MCDQVNAHESGLRCDAPAAWHVTDPGSAAGATPLAHLPLTPKCSAGWTLTDQAALLSVSLQQKPGS